MKKGLIWIIFDKHQEQVDFSNIELIYWILKCFLDFSWIILFPTVLGKNAK